MNKTLSAMGTLISKAPGKSIPPGMAIDALQQLQSTYVDYKHTVAVEKTKRQAINAWKETEICKIKAQQATLELYLKESFKEREKQIEGMFAALDKGIEMGNIDIVGEAMASIVAIAKESPLAQAKEAIAALKDPTVKSIDW
ncbi:hypothetical protein [Aeromonas enteropelogenes]|uniref:hypothetical protein n=1 Tax=Aeromonas enteropelogenes TaxID=29489 RepID=UPI003BA0502B